MKRLYICGLLSGAIGVILSATIPFSFECSRESGFVMDPNEHKRVGYITDFNGLGLTLQKDLQVSLPFKPIYPQLSVTQTVNGTPFTAKVVGVIEKFTWNGGVGDAIAFDFYVSQQNATLLKALGNSTLKTSSVQSIGWWIGDYDQETKGWFEAAKPSSSPTLKGLIEGASTQPELGVDLTPVVAKDGINVSVYKVTVKIVPQVHQVSSLLFANSSTKQSTKTWGLP
jgi:hypothetical protein